MASLRQTSHERFLIADESDAGALRRTVARYAEQLGVAAGQSGPVELRPGRAELAATELATNLLRHAKPGGWVLVRPIEPASVELIAVDRGPGMADPDLAVAGRSPSPGGLGRGLAAVRRAASRFDIHTEPGRGTTVLAVVDLAHPNPTVPASPPGRLWGGVSIGLTGACGDGWAVAELDGCTAVAVVDGLGHGPNASVAADAALAVFAEAPADLDRFVARANDAMRTTRGGVVAVCRLEPDRAELHHLAVGNISARVRYGEGTQRGLGFRSGALGLRANPPRIRAESYPWPAGATLVLWTDGLVSGVDLATDGDLLTHDPAVVAATLHRDHSRERDDATVVVVRNVVSA